MDLPEGAGRIELTGADVARQCPKCGSGNVRRSRSRERRGLLTTLGVLSPYRCEGCGILFRVLSHRLHVAAGVILACILAGVLLWLLYEGFSTTVAP